jgi:hypothetical protein
MLTNAPGEGALVKDTKKENFALETTLILLFKY